MDFFTSGLELYNIWRPQRDHEDGRFRDGEYRRKCEIDLEAQISSTIVATN